MKYYLAPLEGITGYIYRNAYHTYFEPFDKYFLPFIAPHENRSFNSKELNDLMPEHNEGMYVVPQVLTNDATAFLRIVADLEAMGYTEVNLNLGCPSGTVTAKGRGSGFLGRTKELDEFFARVFESVGIRVSVKTRVGLESPDEWEELLTIYNKYPLEELIVHPRVRTDFYNNTPRMECFRQAVEVSKNPLCYNGDLFTVDDYQHLQNCFPKIETTMYGRGILKNPGLLGELKGAERMSPARLQEFHDRIYEDYTRLFSGDRNVLFKMKEIWSYMIEMFEGAEKYGKKIRKSQRAADYEAAVRAIFRECEIRQSV